MRYGSACKTRLLLADFCLYALAGQDEWHEDRHAAAVVTNRNAREAITAINQFFDGKKQEVSVARACFPGFRTGAKWRILVHVEQTQSRDAAALQQPLVDVLSMQLLDLCSRHVAPVGRDIAIGFRAYFN
jgi:hypothetical protein